MFAFVIVLLFHLILADAVVAQESDDPSQNARIRFGPLRLTPGIALTNLGVDSNVFNEIDDPKRDFTGTVSPQLNAWLRAGRSRTSVSSRADLVYFHRYASERSIDGGVEARVEVPGNRLTPWLTAGASSGRQRVGYEIDLRSRRIANNLGLGVTVRVGPKTGIAFSGSRGRYRFDGDAFFLGSSLEQSLNRTTESIALQYLQSLTVLTTFVAESDATRDRFEFSQARNSDSVRVRAGFDLNQRALVAGRVRFGYRKFDAVGGGAPSYIGFVAAVEASTTVAGRTSVSFRGERDVNYSAESLYPYYLLTGARWKSLPA